MADPLVDDLDAVQRDAETTFLVDVSFAVVSPDGLDASLAVEWARDPAGPWAPASAQSFDRKHDASAPLSGLPVAAPGKGFNFVWNAFEDLPEGAFNDVHLRLTVENA